MARDDEGNTPVQVATNLLRSNDALSAKCEGPRWVLDFLRKKAELERAANTGKIAE